MSQCRNESVRHFFSGLTSKGGARSEELPTVLWRLAEWASAGTGIGRGVESQDLVGELMVRICEGDLSSVHWNSLSEPEAVAIVKNRLRQLAVELSPGWNAYRALRAHVAAALEDELPEVPASAPVTLAGGDRLCGSAVASAVAWLRAQSGGALKTASELTQELARAYLPKAVALVPANDDEEASDPGDEGAWRDGVEDALDGARLRSALHGESAGDLRLVDARCRGEGFAEIARGEGVSIGTAHKRVGSAEARVATFVRDYGYSLGAARAFLEQGTRIA